MCGCTSNCACAWWRRCVSDIENPELRKIDKLTATLLEQWRFKPQVRTHYMRCIDNASWLCPPRKHLMIEADRLAYLRALEEAITNERYYCGPDVYAAENLVLHVRELIEELCEAKQEREQDHVPIYAWDDKLGCYAEVPMKPMKPMYPPTAEERAAFGAACARRGRLPIITYRIGRRPPVRWGFVLGCSAALLWAALLGGWSVVDPCWPARLVSACAGLAAGLVVFMLTREARRRPA